VHRGHLQIDLLSKPKRLVILACNIADSFSSSGVKLDQSSYKLSKFCSISISSKTAEVKISLRLFPRRVQYSYNIEAIKIKTKYKTNIYLFTFFFKFLIVLFFI